MRPSSSQPRVLLADDDRSILEALGALLESEGYEVIAAADGHEAVARFHEHRADIAVLDLNMPVKDGWEALDRLKQIDPCLPVIVITARPNAVERARSAGAREFMQKPLHIPELLAAMQRLLAETNPTENHVDR